MARYYSFQVVIMLLFIHCFGCSHCVWGGGGGRGRGAGTLFLGVVFNVLYCFAINNLRKREVFALLK